MKPFTPQFDFSSYFADIDIPEGVAVGGDGVLYMPGEHTHFTHIISPLREVYDIEDILKFSILKRVEFCDFSPIRKAVEEHKNDGAVVSSNIMRIFETTWPIRGMENMLADMVADPDIAEYFFDMENTFNLKYAVECALAGCDMIMFGDDVGSQKGMMMSADLWRKMLKPRMGQIFSVVKKIKPDIVIWYHSCGDVTEIIPDLIEIGLDILNPIQPECMDVYAVQKKYGDKLSFEGGISTQKLMPFGKPDEVAAETKKMIDVFGKNGGYIISPSHVLEPEVPIENIVAYLETARKYAIRA